MKIKLLQTSKRTFPTFVIMLLVVAGLTLGCVSCKSKVCQQDYEQLSMTEFHSLSEGLEAIGDFLSKYDNSKRCSEYCDKVKQVKTEFMDMEYLFSDVDNSDLEQRYCEFVAMVNSNKTTFSHSNFEAVQKTWNFLVDTKRVVYQRERLDLIDENEFKPYLLDLAREKASRWKRDFDVIDYYIIHEQVKTSVVETGGNLKKQGSCTVHVDLVGNLLPDGYFESYRRTAYLDITVEGSMKISDSNCETSFAKGNVSILQAHEEEPGILHIVERGVEKIIPRQRPRRSRY